MTKRRDPLDPNRIFPLREYRTDNAVAQRTKARYAQELAAVQGVRVGEYIDGGKTYSVRTDSVRRSILVQSKGPKGPAFYSCTLEKRLLQTRDVSDGFPEKVIRFERPLETRMCLIMQENIIKSPDYDPSTESPFDTNWSEKVYLIGVKKNGGTVEVLTTSGTNVLAEAPDEAMLARFVEPEQLARRPHSGWFDSAKPEVLRRYRMDPRGIESDTLLNTFPIDPEAYRDGIVMKHRESRLLASSYLTTEVEDLACLELPAFRDPFVQIHRIEQKFDFGDVQASTVTRKIVEAGKERILEHWAVREEIHRPPLAER